MPPADLLYASIRVSAVLIRKLKDRNMDTCLEGGCPLSQDLDLIPVQGQYPGVRAQASVPAALVPWALYAYEGEKNGWSLCGEAAGG